MSIPKKIGLKRVFELVFVCVIAACLLTAALVRSGYVGDLTEQWFTPSQEASYIIGQYNSTFYYLQNHTGYGLEAYDGYEYESTNASAVWNNARGNLSSLATGAVGSIYVKNGTYNVDSPWILGQMTQFVGESGTILNITTNTNAMQIDIDTDGVDGCNWQINDVEIRMNDYNGYGIYSDNASRKDSKMATPRIEGVRIWNVSAGYAGIKLNNFFLSIISGVSIRTKGYGVWLNLDNNLIAGNSQVEEVEVYLCANNAIGLYVGESVAKYYNLMNFDRLQVAASSAYTNTTGVWLNGLRWSSFNQLNLENNCVNLLLNNTRGCTFNSAYAMNSFAHSTDGLTVGSDPLIHGNIVLIKTSTTNTFVSGWFDGGPSQLAYNDSSLAGSMKNTLLTCMFQDINFTLGNSRLNNCVFWNATSGNYESSRYGTTTIVKNEEWISHYLVNTPDSVRVTCMNSTYDGIPITVSWIGCDSTKWQVGVYWTNGTAITDDIIMIDWIAYYGEGV